MITKMNSIFLLNVLIVNCVSIEAINKMIVNSFANSSELKIDRSQQHFPLMNSKSREVRGTNYYSHPLEEHHEYHESIIEKPHYIIKVVAPPKRTSDAGVKELLLVLAPLAAIPLIGSAALTTFTAMFATSGYGKRRKRELRELTKRELLSTHFTEVEPKAHHYISERLIGIQHNVGLENLLDTSHSTESIDTNINRNAKRQPFPENDLISTKIESSFGSQTTPKSGLIGVKDQNNWRPIDTNRNERTGGPKSTRIMSNTNHSLENKDYKSFESLVKGFRERFTQSMISSDQSLGKEEPNIKALAEHSTQVEPIENQQYKSSLVSSAYLKRTDFRPDIIVQNNNTSNESISTKLETKNKEKKFYRNSRDNKDLGLTLPSDMTAQESQITDKAVDSSFADMETKVDNKEKRDRFEYNSWIPFLSNPYLFDIARGEGKRELQELDVIQKYLNAMGRPDYNDEIIATYLSCNGMLSASNQCLERLTCQFSDGNGPMKQLEKDVSSLVIYSLLKNEHIDTNFKTRLQRAALFGKDNPGKCNFYNCPKINVNKNNGRKR